MDVHSGNIAAGATNIAYDVLVPPQAIASGLTITLTIDGTNRAVTVPAGKFTGNALASGQQYIIELLITDAEVSFSGVKITYIGAVPTNPNVEFKPEEP